MLRSHMITTKKMLILMMSLLLGGITVSLSVCYYKLFRTEMLTQLSESYTAQLRLFSQQFDSIVSGSETISQLLYQNEEITGALLSSVNDARSSMQVKSDIGELYTKYDQAFQQAGLAFEIICYSENGFSYSTENLSETEISRLVSYAWFTKQKSLKVIDYTISNFWDNSAESPPGSPCFAIIKNLYSVGGSYAGSIIVYVPEVTLRAVYSEFSSPDNQFFLLNENSVIISSSNQTDIGTSLSHLPDYRLSRNDTSYSIHSSTNGENCFNAKYRSPSTGWTIYEQIPLKKMIKPLNRIIYLVICISIAGYILILFITVLTASYISRPLKTIVVGMRHSIENHFAKIHVQTHLREISDIEACYNQLSEQISALLKDIRISEKKANEASFNFLKAQINPHFLYNSLFSIKCMISMGESKKACEMLRLLISLLQNSVGSDKNDTSLLEESATLTQYVRLQNLRYNDKVHFKIELPKPLMGIQVPRFLIQPLVENVFMHAIPVSDTDVDLLIRFKEADQALWIEVCDTGIGFTDSDFDSILKGETSTATSHIGLKNIQERIHLLYGSHYGLSLLKDDYFHTVIRLCIPKHIEEDENNVSDFSS